MEIKAVSLSWWNGGSTKTPHQNDFRHTGVRGLQLIELHAAEESAGDFFTTTTTAKRNVWIVHNPSSSTRSIFNDSWKKGASLPLFHIGISEAAIDFKLWQPSRTITWAELFGLTSNDVISALAKSIFLLFYQKKTWVTFQHTFQQGLHVPT